MRRTLASFEAEAKIWDKRSSTLLPDMSPVMVQGQSAYAGRQGSIRRQMADYCHECWVPWLKQVKDGKGGIALEDEVWHFV